MSDYHSGVSDESLLADAQGGDKSAYEAFYNRYKRRILNYIARMISNYESAKDLTQEVFVKAYMNLSQFEGRGKPLHWIYAIAGNLCRNYLRDKKRDPLLILNKEIPGKEGISMQDVIPAKDENPADSTMSDELHRLIQTEINQLPAQYREALILCDMQGYSYEEAATMLRCRVGTIGSRLSRAWAILSKALEEYRKEKR